LGNFVWIKAVRVFSRLMWGLVLISVVFAWWSSQKPLYTATLFAGVASSVLGMFVVLGGRATFISYPLLFVAAVLGLEGAVRFAARTGVYMQKAYAAYRGRN
jgi:hypothetical protein